MNETQRDIVNQALAILSSELHVAHDIFANAPGVVKDFLVIKLAEQEREVFAVLYLDNQHGLIEYEELFFGTIDGSSVHPREVIKSALYKNAAAVIFAHNHPSGVTEPSQADYRITERLKTALAFVDIRVLDHIIVGKTDTCSFAERGIL